MDMNINLIAMNAQGNPSAAKRARHNTIARLIRERYSVDEELSILRQRDTKPEEFAEYNAYVEQIKALFQ